MRSCSHRKVTTLHTVSGKTAIDMMHMWFLAICKMASHHAGSSKATRCPRRKAERQKLKQWRVRLWGGATSQSPCTKWAHILTVIYEAHYWPKQVSWIYLSPCSLTIEAKAAAATKPKAAAAPAKVAVQKKQDSSSEESSSDEEPPKVCRGILTRSKLICKLSIW